MQTVAPGQAICSEGTGNVRRHGFAFHCAARRRVKSMR
jgi:hypothetical protein